MNHFVVNLNKVEGFKSLKRLEPLERLERLEPARWVARLLNCANPQLSLIKRFLDGVAGAVLGVQRMEAIVLLPRDRREKKT